MLRTIILLAASLSSLSQVVAAPTELMLVDSTRQRSVPVTVFEPSASACKANCPVAVFGTGYGATVEEYTFLLTALAGAGFFTVGIQGRKRQFVGRQ